MPTILPISSPSGLLADSHANFGFSLLRQLETANKKKNIVVSPLSVALALSMAYNGAAGATQASMADTLALQGMDTQKINGESLQIMNALSSAGEDFRLSVANSIWVRKNVSVQPSFLTANQNYFKSTVDFLDFADPQAAATINGWVSRQTNKTITSIVSPPLPPNVFMYLINAVYFKATWTTIFQKNDNADKPFYPEGLAPVTVTMMSATRRFPYLENGYFQVVALPYGLNERMRMLVFLPKHSLDEFVPQLTSGNWRGWTSSLTEKIGSFKLPKFKTEYSNKLKNALGLMGMQVAFSPAADFSGMTTDRPATIHIDDVIHKTYMSVDEDGTEASAVTAAIPMTGGGMGIPETSFTMEVNRPFFLAIEDTETKELLFTGLIYNPTE